MDDEIVFPPAYLEDGAIDIQALRDDLEMRISCWEGYVWAMCVGSLHPGIVALFCLIVCP